MKKIVRKYDDGVILYERDDGILEFDYSEIEYSDYEFIPCFDVTEKIIVRDTDFDWFVENYDRIYKTYGKCFVAIKNKEIIGVYPSYAEGVNETEKEYELGTFIVQECDGTELAYTAYL